MPKSETQLAQIQKEEEARIDTALKTMKDYIQELPRSHGGSYDITEMAKLFMRENLVVKSKLSLKEWLNNTKELIIHMCENDFAHVVRFERYPEECDRIPNIGRIVMQPANNYLKMPPVEIDEEEFYSALYATPPRDRTVVDVDNTESFFLDEAQRGKIHPVYGRVFSRYFKLYALKGTAHSKIIERIMDC